MTAAVFFQSQHFNLNRLRGISDETLEMHFKLYEGYVKETNSLMEKLEQLSQGNEVREEEKLAFGELTRRLGFVWGNRPGQRLAFHREIDVVHEDSLGLVHRDIDRLSVVNRVFVIFVVQVGACRIGSG